MRHCWTQAEEQQIIEEFSAGKRIVDISNEMGIRYNLIECKVKKLRANGQLPRTERFWTPELEAKVLRLSQAGKTAREIGVIMGKTVDSVRTKISFLRVTHTGASGNEFPEQKKANIKQNQRFVEAMLLHHPEKETSFR